MAESNTDVYARRDRHVQFCLERRPTQARKQAEKLDTFALPSVAKASQPPLPVSDHVTATRSRSLALAFNQMECRRAGLNFPSWIILDEYSLVDLDLDFESTKPLGIVSPRFSLRLPVSSNKPPPLDGFRVSNAPEKGASERWRVFGFCSIDGSAQPAGRASSA